MDVRRICGPKTYSFWAAFSFLKNVCGQKVCFPGFRGRGAKEARRHRFHPVRAVLMNLPIPQTTPEKRNTVPPPRILLNFNNFPVFDDLKLLNPITSKKYYKEVNFQYIWFLRVIFMKGGALRKLFRFFAILKGFGDPPPKVSWKGGLFRGTTCRKHNFIKNDCSRVFSLNQVSHDF